MAADEDTEKDAASGAAPESRHPRSVGEERRDTPSLGPSSLPPPSSSPSKANHRILFAAAWVIAQVALVITAERRIDGAFGFRMFSESSSIKLSLYREIDGAAGRSRVHVDGGVWSAHASDGTVHRLTWYDRVPTPYWVFDQEMHASYGAATQLARLQGALDDVAAHLPNDAETRRFLLDVTIRRNGHEPVVHQLKSRERAESPLVGVHESPTPPSSSASPSPDDAPSATSPANVITDGDR